MSELLPEAVRSRLETGPVDLTYVDADNTIVWFSAYRVFKRSASDMGRDVLLCHSPGSRAAVARLMEEFRTGARDRADFTETSADGRLVQVSYLALRDADAIYRGVLEVVDESSDI